MKLFMFLLFIGLQTQITAKATIRVAVIDTGFDFNSTWNSDFFKSRGLVRPKLCDTGHYDVITKSTKVVDNHGHGTHIAGLIAKYNENTDYCLIIIKYFDSKSTKNTALLSQKAFQKAIDLDVDVINYSGGVS